MLTNDGVFLPCLDHDLDMAYIARPLAQPSVWPAKDLGRSGQGFPWPLLAPFEKAFQIK